MKLKCQGRQKGSRRAPERAAGKGGSVPVGELFRVANRVLTSRAERRCDARHRSEKIGAPTRLRATRACEMGADIAANPHYPALLCVRPSRFIPFRLSCDRQPAKRCALAHAGTIRRRFGRPPFGGRPHLESPSSSHPGVCRSVCLSQAMDCFPVPDRVRVNSWESLRSVTRLSVAFLVDPVRSLPASLATTLDVPAVRRLRRPMI